MSENETSLYGLQVLSRCGSGAYGDVYYCQDVSGKHVALKVISKGKIGSGWERELKGITNYRRLTENSSLLLNIFHVGEDESNFYYTMEPADAVADAEEYIPDSLARRLTAGALPAENLISVLRDILSAIRILHEAGFAHRDIKPENILFINGKPKLADLGLLSPLSGTVTQLAGTLDYLPPEERSRELSPDTRDSRQRNDLYAFGKIIYCCITGNGADQFPSLPRKFPLTLQNKLFFRLAIRLCDKEPSKRLAQLSDVVAAFDDTVRMCQYGEKVSDKLHYACSTLYRNFVCACSHLFKSAMRHWLLSLLCLAALGVCAWYVWPRPPYDITKEQTKAYRRDDLGIEMRIPMEWEVLSSQTAKEWLKDIKDDKKDLSEQEKKRMEFFASLLEHVCDYIICDYAEPNPDNVTIQTVPIPGKELMEVPDDDLRVGMQQLFKGELGFDTKIYDFKRLTLAGRPCMFIDLSHAPGTRVNNYMFALSDKCFAIALTARQETFFERREQFKSILTTLKFKENNGE
ncbi:MAG: protein kinase [Lentisphaerae bacterium]|nr:protein kinase [Lentisphaerota bacterium]